MEGTRGRGWINRCVYLPTGHKGATGELVAAAWLLNRGVEVFRNVSACGPADLMAWRVCDGASFPIDVKFLSNANMRQSDGGMVPNFPKNARPGVHYLFVGPAGVLGFYRPCKGLGTKSEAYDPFATDDPL